MLRRRCFLLSGAPTWRGPSSIERLPNFPGQGDEANGLLPQRLKDNRTAYKGYKPLSLRARQELADASDAKSFHRITPEWLGTRVDDFMRHHYPQWDLPVLAKLVENGHVYRYRHDGQKRFTRLTDRLELDELLVVPSEEHWRQIAPPMGVLEPKEADAEKQQRREITLSGKMREMAHSWVLFKNEHVVCINKPSGVPMHPGMGVTVNITDLLPVWKFTNSYSPTILNRLDRETSGVVVLARSRESFRMLGRMFMKRNIPNNVFWGFCVGQPSAKFGRLRMHLETKEGDNIIARPTATKESRVAIAEFVRNHNVDKFGSFVSFYPLTSQRHQLRIMAAHALRCPILGDSRFGGEAAFPSALQSFWDPHNKGLPLHLHHRKIQLPYKNSRGEFVCVTAPVPPHMKETFEKLGFPCDADDPLIPG